MTDWGRKLLVAVAMGGSALLLLAALGFQYVGGLAPCPMCIWQRWAHVGAMVLGLIAFAPAVGAPRAGAWLGAGAMAGSVGLGVFHAGVEQGWWEGPSTCTAPDIGSLSASDLTERLLATPVVRCDEIPWEFLGISMAGWNAVVSGILLLFWLSAAIPRGLMAGRPA